MFFVLSKEMIGNVAASTEFLRAGSKVVGDSACTYTRLAIAGMWFLAKVSLVSTSLQLSQTYEILARQSLH